MQVFLYTIGAYLLIILLGYLSHKYGGNFETKSEEWYETPITEKWFD